MAKRLLARIKQIREGLDLTQEVFAERAGLGYKYYQSVEAGRRRDIRLSTLEKLAKGPVGWSRGNCSISRLSP
jgi:transcriptional regulator with XRE-family HTH domain